MREELAKSFSSVKGPLSHAKVVREGARIVMKVQGLSQVEMDRFQSKEGRGKVARAVRAVLGRDIPVKFENQAPLEAGAPPPSRPGESKGMKALKERFGGEVVEPPPRQSGLFPDQEGPGTGREEE